MRKISRLTISKHALATLKKRQNDVNRDPRPELRAKLLWRNRNNKAFNEIRIVLENMATGRSRCMYCEDSEGTDIEHYYPKSTFPQFCFSWDNYLLACARCNSNYKREKFPFSTNGEPILVNPTIDDTAMHITLIPSTGEYYGLTTRGDISVDVYGLNRQTLTVGRHDAWVTLCVLLKIYASEKSVGNNDRSIELLGAIKRFPFSSVLWHILRIADMPGASDVLPPEVLEAVRLCPEISTW